MNFNAVNLTINPCVVCDYLFADKHHIWPQAKGGEKLPTVSLCPNHHRYANIVQAMLLQGRPRDEIERFAVQHFDRAFNDTMLAFLMDEQARITWRGWCRFHSAQILQAAQTHDLAAALVSWMEVGRALMAKDRHFAPLSDAEREHVTQSLRDYLAGGDLDPRIRSLFSTVYRAVVANTGVTLDGQESEAASV